MFNVQLSPYKIKRTVGSAVANTGTITVPGTPPLLNMDITRQARITQVKVLRITGTGPFAVQLLADAAALITAAQMEGALGETSLYFNKIDVDYLNEDSPQQDRIYLQITPQDAGTHSFRVRLYFEKL
jgi:hypothetical protein